MTPPAREGMHQCVSSRQLVRKPIVQKKQGWQLFRASDGRCLELRSKIYLTSLLPGFRSRSVVITAQDRMQVLGQTKGRGKKIRALTKGRGKKIRALRVIRIGIGKAITRGLGSRGRRKGRIARERRKPMARILGGMARRKGEKVRARQGSQDRAILLGPAGRSKGEIGRARTGLALAIPGLLSHGRIAVMIAVRVDEMDPAARLMAREIDEIDEMVALKT